MYALIVPASTPFVLLAAVMGLSWWEDHVLPSADQVEARPKLCPPQRPLPSTRNSPVLALTLTKEVARR